MNKISFANCQIHSRPFELICTSPECKKPRLGCTKCFYDKTHKECKTLTVLLEDLFQEQYNENLEGWVNNPNIRKELVQISKIFPGNLKEYSEKLCEVISEKFDKMRDNILKKIEKLEKTIKKTVVEKVMGNETMNLFQEHYYIPTLLKIIENNKEEEKKTEYFNFFNYDIEKFIDLYHNEKELIYFDKEQYSGFLDKREHLFENFLNSLEENLLSSNYFHMLFIPPKNVQSIKRFKKFGNSWGYVKDKYDCISFKTNKNILFHGFSVMRPFKPNEKLAINIKIIEGETNESPILLEQQSEILYKDNVLMEIIHCDPTLMKSDKIYTICLRIEGEDSYNGCEGMEIVEGEDNTIFTFCDTVVLGHNQNNNTNINNGQIPEIYYSSYS